MIEVVRETDTTDQQQEFIDYWVREYFGDFDEDSQLEKATVQWRCFLRHEEELASHLTMTELNVLLDDQQVIVGAIGSLFTARPLQGRGYANHLLDFAEDFLLQQIVSECVILFCFPSLVSFYERRGWQQFTAEIEFEVSSDVRSQWEHSAMLLTHREFPNPSSRLVIKA